MSRTLLSDETIQKEITQLPGWKWNQPKHVIQKTYAFSDFSTALSFVNHVGAGAEKENHHPDVMLAWGRVELSWTTHSSGGLTLLDFKMAKASDELYRDFF